jgi:hypothetical protein
MQANRGENKGREKKNDSWQTWLVHCYRAHDPSRDLCVKPGLIGVIQSFSGYVKKSSQNISRLTR